MGRGRKDIRVRRVAKRVPGGCQRGFAFGGEKPAVVPGEVRPAPLAEFLEGDRTALFLGDMRMGAYLSSHGQQWIIELTAIVDVLDVSSLLERYSPLGRRAIHPRRLLGLIVYGMLVRQWSLRELEALARRDLGAAWLMGGIQPDHSTIGKFIDLHTETLTEEFFVQVVKHVVGRLSLSREGTAALDGTIVGSAASRLGLLKQEVAAQRAKERAREAAEAAAASPDNAHLTNALEKANGAVAAIAERAKPGKAEDQPLIAPADPEAVLQPSKKKVMEPSFKPSVLAVKGRIIVGQVVHPSSETAVVPQLLEQFAAVMGGNPLTVMADAGYCTAPVLKPMCEAGIDFLCPSGKALGEDDFRRKGPNEIAKSDFLYDEEADCYRCPAGQVLERKGTERFRDGRKVVTYSTKVCRTCPLLERCTTSKTKQRRIRRFEGDEYKDAEALVMAQPAARSRYRQRQVLVEPVFAELRERQGLRRFHRAGLRKVRAEFALHCIAHNLKRLCLWQVRCRAAVLLRRRRDGRLHRAPHLASRSLLPHPIRQFV